MADMTMIATYQIQGLASAAVNVISFVDIGGDNDEPTATGIAEEWGDVIVNVCGLGCDLEANTRFVYPTEDPVSEIIAENAAFQGSAGGDLLPSNCAFRIDLFSGLGPSRRGHIYIPGPSEEEIGDTGFIDPVHLAGIVTQFEDFALACATDHGFTIGVHSRVLGDVFSVASFAVDPYLRSQRRRQDRIASA